jgi:hypothetical protein
LQRSDVTLHPADVDWQRLDVKKQRLDLALQQSDLISNRFVLTLQRPDVTLQRPDADVQWAISKNPGLKSWAGRPCPCGTALEISTVQIAHRLPGRLQPHPLGKTEGPVREAAEDTRSKLLAPQISQVAPNQSGQLEERASAGITLARS